MSSDRKRNHSKTHSQSRDQVRLQRKEAQRSWHQTFIRVFTYLFAALLAISILLIPIRPKESDLEKRELAKFPSFSLAAIADGSWFIDIDTWFSDTFPFREQLLICQSKMQRFYGLKDEELYGTMERGDEIPATAETAPILSSTDTGTAISGETPNLSGEALGTLYITNNRGFEIYYFNNDNAKYYASMLNTVHSIFGDSVSVYDLLAPTSFPVYLDEEKQASLGGSNTRLAINYIYNMLDPAIVKVPVLDTLIKHNGEYIYFNTDHHWTQLGAYYAYIEFCNTKGFSPFSISEFKESQYSGFLGTFYSASNQSASLGKNPDTLVTYTPNGTNDCIISENDGYSYTVPVVDDASEYTTGGKYSAFLNGDHALTTINNPSITDGSSCLVVKESYGNAFVPFLVDHYQTVYVVDYRYYSGNLTSFIQQNRVTDIIFLNNMEAILQTNIDEMLALFQ